MSSISSVSVAVGHAITYLTRPLTSIYSPATLVKLRRALEDNLTTLYAPSWNPRDPLSGSNRRCLTLSPGCLPPRVIYAACLASGVQWFDWAHHLGGVEFDLFVDPGCVYIRTGSNAVTTTIWADHVACPAPISIRGQPGFLGRSKSLAQQLIEDDSEEDDHIFSMIAHEVSAPTWMTPVLDKFPIHHRSTSPLSSISSDSRCSSRSSNSSDSYSAGYSSTSSDRQSRRERSRGTKVYVDTTRIDVTPYDGGKTTVLTGGVMLGGGPKKPSKTSPNPHWRPIHV